MQHSWFEFRYDERLNLPLPLLHVEYEELPEAARQEFELKCQEICSLIPERIKELERLYLARYDQLWDVENEESFLKLNDEMNELSRTICDLNLLYLHIEGTYLDANVHA
jgi:hypothetical protein